MIRWKIAQASELKWWERYLRNKEPKAYLDWKKSYWLNFLNKCNVHPEPGIKCLDAGSGPAGIFIILDQQNTDAVDPLIDKYDGQLNIFSKEKYPNVNFISLALEKYQTDDRYDMIFCLNAINHVASWSKCIDLLMNLLKPGGTMILSTDVHRYSFLKHIFRILPGDILHPQQHSIKDYLREIQKHQPISVDSIMIKRDTIFDYYAFVIKK